MTSKPLRAILSTVLEFSGHQPNATAYDGEQESHDDQNGTHLLDCFGTEDIPAW